MSGAAQMRSATSCWNISAMPSSAAAPRSAKTHFGVRGAMWSYAQRRIVTESDSVLVWYDYDRLTKCDPGEAARAVIERRMKLSGEGSSRS